MGALALLRMKHNNSNSKNKSTRSQPPPLRGARKGGEKRQALPDHVSRKVTLRLNTGLPAVWS